MLNLSEVKELLSEHKDRIDTKYREDSELQFLKDLDSNQLDVLYKMLVFDSDGEKRLGEQLSISPLVKRHYPEHSKYWDLLATEYQLNGGNSITNRIRQKGVLYSEILEDVAKQLNVNYPKNPSIDTLEMNLLSKVLENSVESMSDEERGELLQNLNFKTTDFSKQATLLAIHTLLRTGLGYKIALTLTGYITKALIHKGLVTATQSVVARGLGTFSGPVGWAVMGAWTAYDLAGPAYRVTIPATIYIASLRQGLKARELFTKCSSCGEDFENGAKFCPHCGEKVNNGE